MTSICDLPIKIINEIILCVPLIDLFRLSKVCKQFKKLTYKSRGNITNEKEYISAIGEKKELPVVVNDPLKHILYSKVNLKIIIYFNKIYKIPFIFRFLAWVK